MKYFSTKTYGPEVGLSAVFRQPLAKGHCNMLHGYALAVSIAFVADELDHRNWVQDFGGLKEVKAFLQDTFDHKLLIADDDPMKDELCALGGLGLADPVILPAVGCEAFADYIFNWVSEWLYNRQADPDLGENDQRVKVWSVTVAEHAGNSATRVAG